MVCEEAVAGGIQGSLASGFEVTVRQAGHSASFRAKAVIACHGKRAALDRGLNRPFLKRRQPFLALKAHFNGPPLPNRIELHGFPGGYCGMSEIEGGLANVCLLVDEQVFRRARRPGYEPVESFIGWMRGQNPALDRWLGHAERVDESWLSIAQVPFLAKEPVVGDVLLAGDAAGLIAPLAGDGIAMALQGGSMAAGHVAGFLAGDCPAAALPGLYAAAWLRLFGPRLRLGRVLQPLMLRPRLLSVGLRLLVGLPPLGRYVITQTRDLSPLSAHIKEHIEE
jgi:flavin-dependent dehydrogenase